MELEFSGLDECGGSKVEPLPFQPRDNAGSNPYGRPLIWPRFLRLALLLAVLAGTAFHPVYADQSQSFVIGGFDLARGGSCSYPEGDLHEMLVKIANEELKHKEKMEYLYTNTAFPQTDGG